MITLYKESNTEEKFNKKRLRHGHPKKHHTYIYIGENNPAYLPVTLMIEFVFNAACFQSRSLVRVVRKNITWLI